MGAAERIKGQRGERELCRLLSGELGAEYTRTLDQVRDGGADVAQVGPFALEVKRAERLEIARWWAQACRQAEDAGLAPALAYRQSRQPWRFVVPLNYVMIGVMAEGMEAEDWMMCETATVELAGFALIVREEA